MCAGGVRSPKVLVPLRSPSLAPAAVSGILLDAAPIVAVSAVAAASCISITCSRQHSTSGFARQMRLRTGSERAGGVR